ncbi:hypothetical protein ACO2I3_01080 [Leptospira interrogans]
MIFKGRHRLEQPRKFFVHGAQAAPVIKKKVDALIAHKHSLFTESDRQALEMASQHTLNRLLGEATSKSFSTVKAHAKPKVRKDPHNTPDKSGDLIDTLISSGRFSEDDREELEAMTGRMLKKLADEAPIEEDEEPVAHEAPDRRDANPDGYFEPKVHSVISPDYSKKVLSVSELDDHDEEGVSMMAGFHGGSTDFRNTVTFKGHQRYWRNQEMVKALDASGSSIAPPTPIPDDPKVFDRPMTTKDLIMATHHKVKR